jgi:hypothetical protein
VGDRQRFLPEGLQQLSGALTRARAADEFHCAAGEVIVLNVYEQQSLSHGRPPMVLWHGFHIRRGARWQCATAAVCEQQRRRPRAPDDGARRDQRAGAQNHRDGSLLNATERYYSLQIAILHNCVSENEISHAYTKGGKVRAVPSHPNA